MGDGKIHRLGRDGRFVEKILDRIKEAKLVVIGNKLVVVLETDADNLPIDWLTREAAYRFIVNGGTKVIEGRCFQLLRFGKDGELTPPYFVEIRTPCNTLTGEEVSGLGAWKTLEIAIAAGDKEKRFEVKRTT